MYAKLSFVEKIKKMSKIKSILLFTLCLSSMNSVCQTTLTIDDCRSLAVENNKQLSVARLNKEIASDNRQSARTKYLPRVDAMAGYELFSKEVSILNNDQKKALNNLGTSTVAFAGEQLPGLLTSLAQDGLITPDMAAHLGQYFQGAAPALAAKGNEIGSEIRKAFRTNNRNMFAGSVMVRQPLYMGGSITALNNIADINVTMADDSYDMALQNVIYEIDAAYWLVVSLSHKQRLAESYLSLVKKLDEDVHKMIGEGVATRADGLNISVRVNEAEMNKLKVDDNLSLSKMLLCQLCGIPIDQAIKLADEDNDILSLTQSDLPPSDIEQNRPEMRLLQNAVSLSEQASKLVTAAYYRPQVALTGGYLISNPNVYNGFERKFSGIWNVGVVVRMPLWNWNEGKYKLNASKAATTIAHLERSDLREKIDLQVKQQRFKLDEAKRRVEYATKHVNSAEENLRCANLGFHEGVMSLTDVMAAQTAWEMAHNQKIDAEIEVQLSHVGLRKALGQLR